MAAKVATQSEVSGDGAVQKFFWNFLDATNNVGAAIGFAQWADRSVQFNGVFNNCTVVWEGSNDGGTTWTTLTDPQGNGISKTAAAIEAVTEITELARPNVSSAGVATAVTVAAILRRANPMRT